MAKDKKTCKDVKKEYGYCLRWTGGEGLLSELYPPRYYIDDLLTGVTTPINDEDAVRFIEEVGCESFRADSRKCYDNHIALFDLLGLQKIDDKQRIIRFIDAVSRITINQLAEEVGVPNGNLVDENVSKDTAEAVLDLWKKKLYRCKQALKTR